MARFAERPIILFGGEGQVGHAIAEALRAKGMSFMAPDRATVSLAQPTTVERFIVDVSPALIINAAAYTSVDGAESDEFVAQAVNGDSPTAMARGAAASGAAVVHFSTDYVFDGSKGKPYTETDVARPLNVYGRTKLAGDEGIEATGVPHLIFRTSWVYSARRKNFLLAILNRARSGAPLRVVSDQRGAPTSSEAIAAATVDILLRLSGDESGLVRSIGDHSGVYNMSASGATSWHGFAVEILRELSIAVPVEAISTADLGAPAARPRYSILDNSKLAAAFGIRMSDWTSQLADVARELRSTG